MKEYFAQMDYNGDGKVEPEEYIKFVKENYVEKFEEAVQQEAEQFGQYKDQFN